MILFAHRRSKTKARFEAICNLRGYFVSFVLQSNPPGMPCKTKGGWPFEYQTSLVTLVAHQTVVRDTVSAIPPCGAIPTKQQLELQYPCHPPPSAAIGQIWGCIAQGDNLRYLKDIRAIDIVRPSSAIGAVENYARRGVILREKFKPSLRGETDWEAFTKIWARVIASQNLLRDSGGINVGRETSRCLAGRSGYGGP